MQLLSLERRCKVFAAYPQNIHALIVKAQKDQGKILNPLTRKALELCFRVMKGSMAPIGKACRATTSVAKIVDPRLLKQSERMVKAACKVRLRCAFW